MISRLPHIFAAVLALVSLAGASPAKRENCQPAPIGCTLIVRPSGTPTPSDSDPLWSEWNYILGWNLGVHIPNTITRNGNSTVTGPDAAGLYTVEQTLAADALTTVGVIAIATGWAGNTFKGPWSGVDWAVENVTCT